jgi:hypothetical protein
LRFAEPDARELEAEDCSAFTYLPRSRRERLQEAAFDHNHDETLNNHVHTQGAMAWITAQMRALIDNDK